jgi:hypothetical protein
LTQSPTQQSWRLFSHLHFENFASCLKQYFNTRYKETSKMIKIINTMRYPNISNFRYFFNPQGIKSRIFT